MSLSVAALLLTASLLIGVPVARAATFTVDSQSDTVDTVTAGVDANPGDGTCATPPLPGEGVRCTLRAAIMEANALAGPDTINVPAGTYRVTTHANPEDESRSGDFDITSEMTIVGAGRESTIIDARFDQAPSGNLIAVERVLDVQPGGNLTISDVAIQGGWTQLDTEKCGAGIRNRGTVTLNRSIVRDNLVFIQGPPYCGGGGGIWSSGTLTISESLITHNTAELYAAGGGIYNTGVLTIVGSTLSDNGTSVSYQHDTPGTGGLSNSGQATISNSTISGNVAYHRQLGNYPAGNIGNSAQLTLINSTVFSNSTASGSGIVTGGSGAAATLKNTVVVNSGTGTNCTGTITSQGNNLDSGTSCGLSQPTDQSSKNPKLGPLADNGGPTPTHALLAGSPAIDAGADTGCPSTDQRGRARPREGDGIAPVACDIGAYEVQDPYPVDLMIQGTHTPDPPFVGNALTYTLTARTADGNPAPSPMLYVNFPNASQGVTFGSVNSSQGSCQVTTTPTTTVTCFLGTIATGSDAVVTLRVTPTAGGTLMAWAQVLYSQSDPDHKNDLISLDTQVHAVCAPRPNAALQATRIGPGTLQGTVTATRTPLQPNNALRFLQVTRLDNATIAINGAPSTVGQTISLPAGTTQAQVVVTRVAPGPFMAYLRTADECGDWPTFLGGGAGVP